MEDVLVAAVLVYNLEVSSTGLVSTGCGVCVHVKKITVDHA